MKKNRIISIMLSLAIIFISCFNVGTITASAEENVVRYMYIESTYYEAGMDSYISNFYDYSGFSGINIGDTVTFFMYLVTLDSTGNVIDRTNVDIRQCGVVSSSGSMDKFELSVIGDRAVVDGSNQVGTYTLFNIKSSKPDTYYITYNYDNKDYSVYVGTAISRPTFLSSLDGEVIYNGQIVANENFTAYLRATAPITKAEAYYYDNGVMTYLDSFNYNDVLKPLNVNEEGNPVASDDGYYSYEFTIGSDIWINEVSSLNIKMWSNPEQEYEYGQISLLYNQYRVYSTYWSQDDEDASSYTTYAYVTEEDSYTGFLCTQSTDFELNLVYDGNNEEAPALNSALVSILNDSNGEPICDANGFYHYKITITKDMIPHDLYMNVVVAYSNGYTYSNLTISYSQTNLLWIRRNTNGSTTGTTSCGLAYNYYDNSGSQVEEIVAIEGLRKNEYGNLEAFMLDSLDGYCILTTDGLRFYESLEDEGVFIPSIFMDNNPGYSIRGLKSEYNYFLIDKKFVSYVTDNGTYKYDSKGRKEVSLQFYDENDYIWDYSLTFFASNSIIGTGVYWIENGEKNIANNIGMSINVPINTKLYLGITSDWYGWSDSDIPADLVTYDIYVQDQNTYETVKVDESDKSKYVVWDSTEKSFTVVTDHTFDIEINYIVNDSIKPGYYYKNTYKFKYTARFGLGGFFVSNSYPGIIDGNTISGINEAYADNMTTMVYSSNLFMLMELVDNTNGTYSYKYNGISMATYKQNRNFAGKVVCEVTGLSDDVVITYKANKNATAITLNDSNYSNYFSLYPFSSNSYMNIQNIRDEGAINYINFIIPGVYTFTNNKRDSISYGKSINVDVQKQAIVGGWVEADLSQDVIIFNSNIDIDCNYDLSAEFVLAYMDDYGTLSPVTLDATTKYYYNGECLSSAPIKFERNIVYEGKTYPVYKLYGIDVKSGDCIKIDCGGKCIEINAYDYTKVFHSDMNGNVVTDKTYGNGVSTLYCYFSENYGAVSYGCNGIYVVYKNGFDYYDSGLLDVYVPIEDSYLGEYIKTTPIMASEVFDDVSNDYIAGYKVEIDTQNVDMGDIMLQFVLKVDTSYGWSYTTDCYIELGYYNPASSENNIVMGSSMTLDGSVGYNFMFDIDPNTSIDYFMVEGSEGTKKYNLSELENVGSYYYLTYYIAVKDMHKDIKVTAYDKSGNIVLFNNVNKRIADGAYIVNPNDYLKILIEMSNISELASYLYDYGVAARAYFYGDVQVDEDVEIADLTDYKAIENGTIGNGCSYAGTSLILESKTKLRFYFIGNASGNTVKIDGKLAEVNDLGNVWYVETDGICPCDYDHMFSIEVNGWELQYCVLSYCNAASGISYMRVLNNSIYNINLLAKRYYDLNYIWGEIA